MNSIIEQVAKYLGLTKEEVDLNNIKDEFIILKPEEYEQLQKDSDLLNCLRNAGVDNWDGWDYAVDEYHEIYKDDE